MVSDKQPRAGEVDMSSQRLGACDPDLHWIRRVWTDDAGGGPLDFIELRSGQTLVVSYGCECAGYDVVAHSTAADFYLDEGSSRLEGGLDVMCSSQARAEGRPSGPANLALSGSLLSMWQALRRIADGHNPTAVLASLPARFELGPEQ